MKLLHLRKKLVELSGLYSLVKDYTGKDYSDNGADFFIKEGQKWLERLLDSPQAPADYKVSLSAGEYFKDVSEGRAISDVRIEVPGQGVKYLEKKTVGDLNAKYGDKKLFEEVQTGEPADWGFAITRQVNAGLKFANVTGTSGKRLYILPPADKDYTVFVTGLFFSQELSKDSDQNFWSISEPAVLIQSALYMRETFLRNTQGMADWKNAIMEYVNGIDMDLVEEDSANVDQMQDAWNMRNYITRRKYNDV